MNVLDAVEAMGIKTKRMTRSAKRGVEYWSSCPACGGSNRFHIWTEQGADGSYWCRQCGKTGDLVQFFVDFKGMEYLEAFKAAGREPLAKQNSGYKKELSNKGLFVSKVNSCKKVAVNNKQMEQKIKVSFDCIDYPEPCQLWKENSCKLVEYAHKELLNNQEQLNFLAERGINLDLVKADKLGYLNGEKGSNAIYRHRSTWGLEEIIKENGKPKMLWIPRGIIIPCFNSKKEVIRVRIRRPKQDLQDSKIASIRYYVLPGSSIDPLVIFPERKVFVVVESELDAVMLSRFVGTVAGVIALGSAQAKPTKYVYELLRKAELIMILLDKDSAGRDNYLKFWAKLFKNSQEVDLPVGKDPGEAFQAGVDLLNLFIQELPERYVVELQKRDSSGLHIQSEVNLQLQKESVQEQESILQSQDIASKTSEITIIESRIDKLIDKSSPLPYSILKLKALLDVYPVKIQASKTQTRIIPHPEFDNQSVTAILSQLVFWDAHVWDFLENHPAEYIDRTNFMAVYDECFA